MQEPLSARPHLLSNPPPSRRKTLLKKSIGVLPVSGGAVGIYPEKKLRLPVNLQLLEGVSVSAETDGPVGISVL